MASYYAKNLIDEILIICDLGNVTISPGEILDLRHYATKADIDASADLAEMASLGWLARGTYQNFAFIPDSITLPPTPPDIEATTLKAVSLSGQRSRTCGTERLQSSAEIILPSNPTDEYGAATKMYVDDLVTSIAATVESGTSTSPAVTVGTLTASAPLTGGGSLDVDRSVGIAISATNLRNNAGSLDTIQDIATGSSPTFLSVNISAAGTSVSKDGSNNLTLTDTVAGALTLSEVASSKILYIKGATLNDNTLANVSDGTNWPTAAGVKAVIKAIKIVTSSTDWNLTIYCDSDQASGMFASISLATNANGNKDILLDLPYIDNDSSTPCQVHLLFVDNGGSNSATCDVYALQAR